MTYSVQTWTNGTTPVDQTHMSHIETGISAAYPKDGTDPMTAAATVSLALSGASKAFLDLNATDKEHWQVNQDTSGNLIIFNVGHSVQAFVINPSNGNIFIANNFNMTTTNAGIEIGNPSVSNTPFIDFHSSGGAARDYDVRVIASVGNTGVDGQGTLNIVSGTLQHNGQTIWDAASDGSGSGLDADLLDGHNSTYFLPAGGGTMTGGLTLQGMPTLASGNQETGDIGVRSRCETNGGIFGTYKSFFLKMTNTPASISLSSASSNIVASTFIGTIDTKGFIFEITSSGIGGCFWYGTYSTIGNCIIALDEAARTFDHHCDSRDSTEAPECGHIRRGLSVDTDMICVNDTEVPGRYGLQTTPCPKCGSVEHFKVDFAAGDETVRTHAPRFEDRAEVLAAQPFLIRRVQALRGLPMR